MDYQSELLQMTAGCFGGLIAETLHWRRVAKRGRWPKYATSPVYWFLSCLLILAGGVVAAAVSNASTTSLQLLLLGIVGPQLLETIAQAQTLKYSQKELQGETYLGSAVPSVAEFLAL